MADISKVTTLDGTTYDIKDAAARAEIDTLDSEVVKTVAQTLTDAQKTQARTNITAADGNVYQTTKTQIDGCTASGNYSHAEGQSTKATGTASHAEGYQTTASGMISHAEGQLTTASATDAHAEGAVTTASGEASHAEGLGTIANHRSQHVFGERNIADTSEAAVGQRGEYIEIVGNGTADDARSNARTLDWSGNEALAGKLTVGAAPTNNMDVATKQYVDGAYVPATATPLMDGTAAVGTATKYAREDHRHPVDTSRAAASHTHSANDITSIGYLTTHPENEAPTIIPFINNDLAFLKKRGGSTVVKYDGVEQSVDISNVFDGSASYWSVNNNDITTIVVELTLHKAFQYTSKIYVDFGGNNWRANSVIIEAKNSTYENDVWTQKFSTTTNSIGHVYVNTSHTPVGASNSGAGFNMLRFTFSDWKTVSGTGFRIAQIGVLNFGSQGTREPFMSRGLDDPVFRSITPNADNTYALGSSSKKWSNVYATTFTGALSGNASTATTATNVSASAGTANSDRHVWFSDSSAETKRAYDDDFKYNPSTNVLTVGSAAFSSTVTAGTAANPASVTNANDLTTKAYVDGMGSGKIPDVTYGTASVIVDTTTVSFSKDGDNDWYISGTDPISGMTFADDTLYTVTWDGTDYDVFHSASYFLSSTGLGDYECDTVGNLSVIGHDSPFETNAPFLIAKRYKQNESNNVYILTTSTAVSHTVKVTATSYTKLVMDKQLYEEVFDGRPASYLGSGDASTVMNYGAVASGDGAAAFNDGTKATGNASSAFGSCTNATKYAAFAEGINTTASGSAAHAEGSRTVASGAYSHAEGTKSTATGGCAHAEGQNTLASGNMSYAGGNNTISNHKSQHVFGEWNVADPSSEAISARGNYAEIVGNGTADDARSNARTLDWDGNEKLSGDLTVNTGTANEMAVGAELQTKMPIVTYGTPTVLVDTTTVSFSKDGDNDWYISGTDPISGMTFDEDTLYTVTWDGTDYDGYYFYGYRIRPDGNAAYDYSAVGNAAVFQQDTPYDTNAPFAIVKKFNNGESNNIRIVTSSQAASHSVKVTATPFVKTVIDEQLYEYTCNGRPVIRKGSGDNSVIFNGSAVASGKESVAFGVASKSTGLGSVTFGAGCVASNTDSFSIGQYTVASGIGSLAEGGHTTAGGFYTHAEGYETQTSNYASHAEGRTTTASGNFSHAEGTYSVASGGAAHAEGTYTTASGSRAHSEGDYTVANHLDQHVFGSYNIADPSAEAATAKGTYIEIVGNGTADDARSNARTLDWSGNEVLAGSISARGYKHNPLETKTYTDVIATSNDNNGAGFFYLKVRGDTYNSFWHVKTRVVATVPGYDDYYTDTTFDLWGNQNTYRIYSCINKIKNTGARPIYYNCYFRVSQTGYNNNCGGWVGFNLYASNNPTNTSYKRTVVVELLEYDNCSVEFQDSLITPTNIPNRAAHTDWYSSSNTSFDNLDACNNGLKQSGDANSTSICNLMYRGGTRIADSALYRYQLMVEIDADTLSPFNNVNNSTATSKTLLTNVEFNAFGNIFYYNSTTNVAAGAAIASDVTMYSMHGIDLRYSLNCGTTLTANKEIYLVVTPTSGGKCKLNATTQWTHTLPSANDGLWYILLGRTYSTYQIALYPRNPVYYHNGTEIKEVADPNIAYPTELPAVTSSDNGKVLRVVSGAWAAVSLPSASGVSF